MADLGEDIPIGGGGPPRDPLADFEAFLRGQGLLLKGYLRTDARIHRCATVNKPRERNGADLYDPAGPWGWCQDWQTNDKPELWFGEGVEPGDRWGFVRAAQEAYEAERQAMQDETARNAVRRFSAANCEYGHAGTYLERKGIQSHGARLEGDSTILVPMYDNETGLMVNIQAIAPGGEKRFMKGGRVAGCHLVVGAENGPDTAYVAEGFATAATIYEATGNPCVVAFSASNLTPTVKWRKERAPGHLGIVMCGWLPCCKSFLCDISRRVRACVRRLRYI